MELVSHHTFQTLWLEQKPVGLTLLEATKLFLFHVHGMSKQADISVFKLGENVVRAEGIPLQEDQFGRTL